MEMKVKPDLEVSSADFWYDLTKGGYLKPSEILVESEDVRNVENAIQVLTEFENSCKHQIEGFEQ
jgi:hypothetical protein